MVHDSDGFNRWEAGQTLALRMLMDMLDTAVAPWTDFLDSYGLLLDQCLRPETDKALLARALALPDVSFIGQHRDTVDPAAIYAARESVLAAIRQKFSVMLRKIYNMHHDPAAGTDFAASSRRALKNITLRILNDEALAKQQYDVAQNMTDRVAALAVLGDGVSSARAEALADFYKRFESYPLVIDKWFSLQATAIRATALQDVTALRAHPAFNIKNPNRARSLYGGFAMNNPVCFHAADGGGYKLLADAVIELNGINPQIAARMLTPFKEWRRYTPDRQTKMKPELQRIAATQGLSPDVFEIVSKTLA
jgi:aminopeptidase N